MTMHGTGLHCSRRLALAALAVAALGCTMKDAAAPRPELRDAGVMAQVGPYAPWGQAVRMEESWPGAHPNFNTPYTDGCPASSRDGKTFFMASTRPGSRGIDIWVSRRASVDEPWGEPVNIGEPINSASNDFCPMPARDGHEFFFVSNRPGGCGGDDIYVTRFRDDGTVEEPENLGCDVNSAGNEAGPVPVTEPGRGPVLYFSSTRAGGFSPEPSGVTTGDADVYSSESKGGRYQHPALVPDVNSAQEDGQPYIERDALELYFFSTRPGGMGAQDIWMASRANAHDAWSTPVNLGGNVNTPAAETRPSLSWDGSMLYFGSTRSTGEANIYVSRREGLDGRRP
jgi:hypothetical protein